MFRLTNSIDTAWYENPEVRALVGPTRSTSVGDVVVLSDETGSRAFRCDPVGWAQI